MMLSTEIQQFQHEKHFHGGWPSTETSLQYKVFTLSLYSSQVKSKVFVGGVSQCCVFAVAMVILSQKLNLDRKNPRPLTSMSIIFVMLKRMYLLFHDHFALLFIMMNKYVQCKRPDPHPVSTVQDW